MSTYNSSILFSHIFTSLFVLAKHCAESASKFFSLMTLNTSTLGANILKYNKLEMKRTKPWIKKNSKSGYFKFVASC